MDWWSRLDLNYLWVRPARSAAQSFFPPRSPLRPGWKRAVYSATFKKVDHDAASETWNTIYPTSDILVDEEDATDIKTSTLSIVRTTGAKMKSSMKACLEYELGILRSLDVAVAS